MSQRWPPLPLSAGGEEKTIEGAMIHGFSSIAKRDLAPPVATGLRPCGAKARNGRCWT